MTDFVEFNEEQIERYSRHIILPEVGGKGQAKLLRSKVFVLGAGGLGSPSLYYLAAAGVGTIGLADNDVVELTNLQRQIIHDNERIGMDKTLSAKQTINKLNPDVNVILHNERVTAENAREIIRDYDVILDGSDNFPTRFLLNDACFFEKKPLVSGSMFRFEGQVAVFAPHDDDAPCYRCLYGEPPPPALAPSCNEAGVLGALPGVIGVLQAVETIKLILGIGESLKGKLLAFDALRMSFHNIKTHKDPDCALCSKNATITHLEQYEQTCGLAAPGEVTMITATELEERISSDASPVLLDIREEYELDSMLGHLDGIVHIPLASLERRASEMASGNEVVVVCRTGHRAVTGADILLKKEFKTVSILEGGMVAWRKDVG